MTKVLAMDNDRATALSLQRTLEQWGLDVITVDDGPGAWDCLQQDPSIALGILDWPIPGSEGLELCRRIRAHHSHHHMYLLLGTSRDSGLGLGAALDAGADDYVIKPFGREELRARVQLGLRVLTLQQTLAERVKDLQTVHRLLPICSYCKGIRSDQNYWGQLEDYLAQHAALEFSHGVCPSCYTAAMAQLAHG